ncbi:MAG: helix-turn-helix domain-containing protein [Gemmatimonadetes bacterium]|nr:helix-turn-helix domain-containing protein [Gemmatimonadota bacterium]
MTKARGRPSVYKAANAEQAFKLCLLGATDADLADFFDVDERTINRWKQAHPKFCQSIKGGKRQADATVAESLYKRANGYEHDAVKILQYEGSPVIVPYVERYPPDTTAAIFWLKNRRPEVWRDKQLHEHTGKGGGPIEMAARMAEVPDEELFSGRDSAASRAIGAG